MDVRTVYVGNLTVAADEKALRSIFDICGEVTQVRLAGKPGHDKIFSFVEFAHPAATEKALAMDGLQVGEFPIRVKMARANPAPANSPAWPPPDGRGPAAPAVPRRGPPPAAYAAPQGNRADYGTRDYAHPAEQRRDYAPQPPAPHGDPYRQQPPGGGYPPAQPAYPPQRGELLPPAYAQPAPRYREPPPQQQPQWKRGAAPVREAYAAPQRQPDNGRYPPPAVRRSDYAGVRGAAGGGYGRTAGGGGYAAHPTEWRAGPPAEQPRPMVRQGPPPAQPRYDAYNASVAPRAEPPAVSRYGQPQSRADAYGRQPPERDGWRDRDRGGCGGRPHAPPASRSAATASYAGRGGLGRRPDDPERVRRTVFVDNVETHYNEESIAVFFSRLGTVTAVRLGPENHGVRRAWAEFQSEDEAKLALQYNQQLLGSKKVRVEPSKSAIHNSGLQRDAARRADPEREHDAADRHAEAGRHSRSRSRSPVLRRSTSLERDEQALRRSDGDGAQHGQGTPGREQDYLPPEGEQAGEADTAQETVAADMQVDQNDEEIVESNGITDMGSQHTEAANTHSNTMRESMGDNY